MTYSPKSMIARQAVINQPRQSTAVLMISQAWVGVWIIVLMRQDSSNRTLLNISTILRLRDSLILFPAGSNESLARGPDRSSKQDEILGHELTDVCGEHRKRVSRSNHAGSRE